MLALEVALGLPLQLEGEGVQDHGPAPRRRRQAGQVCLTGRERGADRVCDTPPRKFPKLEVVLRAYERPKHTPWLELAALSGGSQAGRKKIAARPLKVGPLCHQAAFPLGPSIVQRTQTLMP